MVLYTIYIGLTAILKPEKAPAIETSVITFHEILQSIVPPLVLIVAVLGSILGESPLQQKPRVLALWGQSYLRLAEEN